MLAKTALLAALAIPLLASPILAQPAITPPAVAPAAPLPRIRGTIEAVDGHTLTIKARAGETMVVRLADDVKVVGVAAAKMSDIKPGLFIGTASIPGLGDTQQATEVTLFPASMNGAGEGSYAWDLSPGSTMTNGTIGDITQANGRAMTVKYNGKERQIVVPDDVPVVLLNPAADMSLVKAGAAVVIAPVKAADGTLTASRINVGENGTVPPM